MSIYCVILGLKYINYSNGIRHSKLSILYHESSTVTVKFSMELDSIGYLTTCFKQSRTFILNTN